MSEELLPYYNRELAYIRRLAGQFAQTHPKIAARLRLTPDASEDPHVERLIQAFAYLNARIRHKLDDEFPELTESLLGVLYPHYLAPIPSMAVVQFELDSEQTELTSGYEIARGTMIETDPIQGESVKFRTTYPVTLWPIELRSASLTQAPFVAPPTPRSSKAMAVLKWSFSTRSRGVKFSQLALGSLRLYLRGLPALMYKLYELLCNNVLDVVIAAAPEDRNAVLLTKDHLRPVGFEPDEGLLPYPSHCASGYRLLTEYFAFPEKYLFLDLTGLTSATFAKLGNTLEVYIYLSRSVQELEQNVSADSFRLGCTPVVNLYPLRAEPISLTQTDTEYRIIPDVRRQLSHEIYSIDRVTATSPTGQLKEYRPFFSVKHGETTDDSAYWNGIRRPAESGGDIPDRGTEMHISLVDLGFNPSVPADWTLTIETTCMSRDLPSRLPFGPDQPKLQFCTGGALVSKLRCLTPPTPTRRPPHRQRRLWRLISHLSLNYLSLVESGEGADALREILKLYDVADSLESRKLIEGVLRVQSSRATSRAGRTGPGAICRGTDVSIEFDAEAFVGSGMYLFASVLERFLGMYCTINSFTRLTARVRDREEVLRRWPARVGEKVLL